MLIIQRLAPDFPKLVLTKQWMELFLVGDLASSSLPVLIQPDSCDTARQCCCSTLSWLSLVLVQLSKSLTPPDPLHWSSVQELRLALSYLPVQWEGNWTWHWHGWAHELLHKSVSSWDLRSGFPSCCRLVLVTGPQRGQTLDKPNQRDICRNL